MKNPIFIVMALAAAVLFVPAGNAQAQIMNYPGYSSGISPYSHSFNVMTNPYNNRYSGYNGYNNYNSYRNYGNSSYRGYNNSKYGNSNRYYNNNNYNRTPSHSSHNNHWDSNRGHNGWSR